MGTLRKYTNRIFEHDGLVVVFAGFKRSYECSLAHIEHGRLVPDAPSPSVFSNWSLLSLLDQRFETAPDFGEEVLVAAQKTPVHNLLKKFNADLRFLSTVAPIYGNEPGWVPLAKNKYGSPVSGAIVNNRKLKILIFPKVTNQVSFLCELFNSVLPELVPHLFPEHVGAKWVEDSQYELTNIVALKGRILEVEASARNETESLTQAIAAERAKMSFQYDLLRETGEKLV